MIHIHLADQYKSGSSLIHQLDPRIKIIGTILFVVAATVLPFGAWLPYTFLWLGSLAAAALSRLGWSYALKRSFVALPFALAAITLPFTIVGQPIAHIGSFTISAEGSVRFLSILIKSWVSVQIAMMLPATTRFADLLWAMRELRIPKPLVGIVSFMYRYLFVFADEALRLLRARAARSATIDNKGGGSLWWRGKIAGGMVGNLALRAFERSERIYDAMISRGFQDEIKILAPPRLTNHDVTLLIIWVICLATVLLIGFI
ncbi:MAG: cobalt ECF transporter T component CbiQ [Chloroflexi bacterium]|nr:cobalt ECF transporter T component CbiQ [Chloroflexota bacterium]